MRCRLEIGLGALDWNREVKIVKMVYAAGGRVVWVPLVKFQKSVKMVNADGCTWLITLLQMVKIWKIAKIVKIVYAADWNEGWVSLEKRKWLTMPGAVFFFPWQPKVPLTHLFRNFDKGTFDFSRAYYRKLSRASSKISRSFFPKKSRASWKFHGQFEKKLSRAI